MTSWGLAKQILLDQNREIALAKAGLMNDDELAKQIEPSYMEIHGKSSVVYRQIENLLKKGYVRKRGRVEFEGKNNPAYGLSYRGTLSALLLPEISGGKLDDLVMIEDGNIILTIALHLLSDGIPEAFIASLLLDGLREDLRRGHLNIDAVGRDEGDRILYARFLKRLYDEREALIKNPAFLRRLSNTLKSMGFPPATINLFPDLLSRMAGQLLRNRVAEREEFLDLFTYLVEGPRPYGKSLFRSRPRSHAQ